MIFPGLKITDFPWEPWNSQSKAFFAPSQTDATNSLPPPRSAMHMRSNGFCTSHAVGSAAGRLLHASLLSWLSMHCAVALCEWDIQRSPDCTDSSPPHKSVTSHYLGVTSKNPTTSGVEWTRRIKKASQREALTFTHRHTLFPNCPHAKDQNITKYSFLLSCSEHRNLTQHVGVWQPFYIIGLTGKLQAVASLFGFNCKEVGFWDTLSQKIFCAVLMCPH